MKYELVSVVDMWEKLKDFDKKSVWNDESVFESVSMDDFVDDVNEMYRLSGGKDGWYMSDFENVNEFGMFEKNGDYLEIHMKSAISTPLHLMKLGKILIKLILILLVLKVTPSIVLMIAMQMDHLDYVYLFRTH